MDVKYYACESSCANILLSIMWIGHDNLKPKAGILQEHYCGWRSANMNNTAEYKWNFLLCANTAVEITWFEAVM